MKTIKSSLFILFTLVILTSCSGPKKLAKGMMPKGVVCDSYQHCEVEDPFDANINVMKQCFKSPSPKAIRNYDGHSIIVRGISPDRDLLNTSLRYTSATVIAKYFDILANIYYKKHNKDIKKYLKQFVFYKEENTKKDKEVIKKILTQSDLSNLQTLGNLNLSDGRFISCKYFNVNSYIERRFIKIMPKSFKTNLPELLKETDKEFNKYMKRNFASKEKPIDIGDMFVQKYYKPTKKQVEEASKRLQEEKPLVISFCKQAILANERLTSCTLPEKTELTLVDLIELSYLPLMTTIDLRGSNIKNLSYLAYIKNLKKIYIMPEQKNEDEIDVLKMTLPNIEIIIYGEKELKRKDELNTKIEAAMETIKKLEKKKRRTRNRKKKKRYQKEIDTWQGRIDRAQPELKKINEFLAKEESRKLNAKKREIELQKKEIGKKIYNLNGKVKLLEKSLKDLEDERYKNKDNDNKIKEIDKKIESIENQIIKTKKEIKELKKK